MNTKYLKLIVFAAFSVMLALTSCVKDLNTIPLDKDVVTSATVYDDPANYEAILAKCYAGLALTGQQGPSGMGDLGGVDEGFSSYVRGLWNLEELPSDEAVTGWGDAGLVDFHAQDWSSSNDFIKGFYYRVYYQITLANEFIRESTDAKLDSRKITGTQKTAIQLYRAEARFLRAFSYWHALDMFGSVPFVTENDAVGSYFPKQISKADLFKYIETELLDLDKNNLLAAPKTNVYGRVDMAAVWMLLSKLYLNAEVYTGTPKYTECITYAQKVINSGYSLDAKYANLFLTDNYNSKEIIWPIVADGTNAQTWGSTTFIIDGGIGGSMVPADYGVIAAWAGHRATKALVKLFPIYANATNDVVPVLKSTAAYPVIYCPGDYQSASGYSTGNWDPGNAPKLASVNSDNKYEGYIYFSADATFKFTAGPNWDVNWGDTGANGTLDSNGDNINVKQGFYKVNVDLNTMTYSMVKITTWGVIGAATTGGWDTSTPMTFDATTRTWSVIINLSAGDFKFRANDGWDINLGDNGANGTLENGGANITVTVAGKYKIILNVGTPDYTYSMSKYSTDGRPLFYTNGQDLEISDITKFTQGYAVVKFKNISSKGVAGSNSTYSDTDFPMFRLADAYMIYVEAVLRGGTGGNTTTALNYVNLLRQRAYGDTGGNITSSDLTLSFIRDELAREFYWEGHRRTDLIRFGQLTGGTYLWPWKGGVAAGVATDAKYNIFPIPASDVVANPNLTQNTGY